MRNEKDTLFRHCCGAFRLVRLHGRAQLQNATAHHGAGCQARSASCLYRNRRLAPWDAHLNQLESQVDTANKTLKEAEANFRAARAQIGFARSNEAPTIGVAPSISTVRDSANEPYFPHTLANNGGGNFTLPVDLNYEIDLWGRIRRGVTSAREQAQASDADLESARLSLHAELAIDYFGLRAADAQEKLLDDTVTAYAR